MRPIQSAQNPSFKHWKTLLDGRGVKKAGDFIISGRKIVPELLATHFDLFSAVIVADDFDFRMLAVPADLDCYALPNRLFKELDIFGTDYPLLVGRCPELESCDLAASPRGLEVLCALGDPANLGALLRSCEAFGVKKIILLEECAHPFHPKSLRASSGSALRLQLESGPSIESLGGAGVTGPLLLLDQGGEDIRGFNWPADVRLLLGEEGRGIPEALIQAVNLSDADTSSSARVKPTLLSIPIDPKIESLNAVVAASIALYAHSGRS